MISAFHGIKIVKGLDPIAKAATWNSTGVDRYGFGDCLMVVHVGVGATPLAAGVYYTLTFEESDSLSSGYSTIAAADLQGGLTGTKVVNSNTKDEQVIVRGYCGQKRYVRVTGTLTGTDTSSTTLSVLYVLANPNKIPITPVTEV